MLKTRIVTALAMLGVFLVVFVVLPPTWFALALAFLLALAAWEWGRLCLPSGSAGAIAFGCCVGAFAVVLFVTDVPVAPAVAVAVPAWCLSPVLMRRWSGRTGVPASALVVGVVALVPAYLAIVALRGWAGESGAYLWMLLVLVWSADIGAYFVGRKLGRRKLAPRVSPGKTWEGLFGGVACAAAAGVGAIWLFPPGVPTTAPVWIGVCVGTAAFSVLGDLTESLLKRMAGVKDSSQLLPGHGGLLDRIDAILAAAPFFALAVWLFQTAATETLW